MLRHMKWADLGQQDIAILVPTKDFKKADVEQNYIVPLEQQGVPREKVLVLNLDHNSQGKYPIRLTVLPWMEKLHKAFKNFGIKYTIVCEGTYFKKIAKVSKVDPHYGYVLQSIWDDIKVAICPNYTARYFNPNIQSKIDWALTGFARAYLDKDSLFSDDLTRHCVYPDNNRSKRDWISMLSTYKELSCDIETYGLKLDEAGLATIAFAWDTTHAVSFRVNNNQVTRDSLRHFFVNYKGKLIFHNATYDAKVIIYELFMRDSRDYAGMLEGLHALFRDTDDTKILGYLSLNSAAQQSYSLKDLAFEFTGNYALEEIKDITKVDRHELLKYNATDALATFWVYRKYRPIVQEEQERTYQDVFRPALKVLTQTELCGMPMNFGKILATRSELDDIVRRHYKAIMDDPIIKDVEDLLHDRMAEKANEKLKKLRKTREDFANERFNPGSHLQLQVLLYEVMGLPVVDTTETGQPATGGKTIKVLIERISNSPTLNKTYIPLLEHIKEWGDAQKILNTFIPAFLNNVIEKDGWHYLHGSFNLGVVKSGRLSSSDPNLQNIPSTGTDYAKPVKQCFQAPPYSASGDKYGWLFCGADFLSLEDRISALQTKDPNKLKIYTDGYDGHCLRAYSYFGDQMPDIDPDSVESINSIAEKYPKLRQLSKSPTFLLTYMGTWKGLVKTFGFTPEMAKKIADNYHQLYAVSDKWVMDKVREASKTGYVELAFGLRLRTPVLTQVLFDSDSMPFQAHKEIKTAGNALGQSYGLLNTRAANEFMERVWASEYKTSILPVAQIHDALYFMVRNTLGCLKFLNDNLIECMEWNELPEIQHPEVKLGAELEVYFPDWSRPIPIPNRVPISDIKSIMSEYVDPGSAG